MWRTRKDYDNLIKKTWCTKFYGSYMYCLVKKCSLLKVKSKIWNRTQFGNILRQLRLVDQKLLAIQATLLQNQADVALQTSKICFFQKDRNFFPFHMNIGSKKVKRYIFLRVTIIPVIITLMLLFVEAATKSKSMSQLIIKIFHSPLKFLIPLLKNSMLGFFLIRHAILIVL